MDIRLIDTKQGGEITVNGGTPDIDNGLNTSVYISLFTENNWWGGEIGSRAYLIKKNNQDNRNKLKNFIQESLQWLIDDGVAEKINISLSLILSNQVGYDIIIKQPELSEEVIYKFSLNWENQAASLKRINNGY